VLASLVIKIEQLRTRHHGSGQVCRLPFVSTFPVTNKPPSISNFQTPFLIGELADGERDFEPKTSGEHQAKQSSFAVRNAVKRLAKRPFLTGSGSQTDIDVTRRKQTTKKILTGARTHISDSAAQLSKTHPKRTNAPTETEL
jgi:hypothetical protein